MRKNVSLIAVVVLLLTACNNTPKPAEEKPATPAAAPVETKAAFTPYKARLSQFETKDFDKWYAEFIKPDSAKDQWGLTDPGVGRLLDNDKKVIVMARVTDMEKAKAFDNSAGRKSDLKKAGVNTVPTPTYWDVIMDDTSHIPQMERVMVVCKVKDYEAWKKGFDGEGMATRKANGFYERAISRRVDEPNTVGLIFAVTDMEKTKARLNSPELKKIMADSGVEGAPDVTWFKWVKM